MSTQIQPISHLESQSTDLTTRAADLTITTAAEAEAAKGFGDELRALKKQVAEYWNNEQTGPTALAHRAWKASVAKRDAMLAPLDEADKRVSRVLGEWTEEQRRQARERQRIAEEEERKRRQEEARIAAAEARKQGATKEEAKVLKQQIQAQPINVPIAPPPKVSGVTVVDNWKGCLDGTTAQEQRANLILLIQAAAKNPAFISLLTINEKAVNARAAASSGTEAIPGIRFYNDSYTRRR